MNPLILAQLIPYDGGTDTPKPPAPRPMDFSDFQNGMKQWNDGATDNTLRNGLLVVLVLVILIGLAVHLRQRIKSRPELNNAAKLGRELSRVVPFPFATRFLLWWVAKSTHVHVATLLISSQAFETNVSEWASRHTFTPLRTWAAGRLATLKPILFAAS